MFCLNPPLKRMPYKGVWLCPDCTAAKKEEEKQEKKARREERQRDRGGSSQQHLSAYERERLDNISRNNLRLAELGLLQY
jgi:uncharacterized Zn finger protein (UPF0148 family)